MTKEDRREITVKGLLLGLILFVSMLIALLIDPDMQNLKLVGTSLIPIIIGYCLLGIFIRWLVYRSTLEKKGFHLFSSNSIVYLILALGSVFMAGAYGAPQVIRYIVVANVVALLLVWLLNCLYLKNIAKELNSNLKYFNRILSKDLPMRPQTEDKFMEEIENYCKKNHLTLEIMEYGNPAKIKMNNALYMAKLGQYYSYAGTLVYTLEFHNLVSKISNK